MAHMGCLNHHFTQKPKVNLKEENGYIFTDFDSIEHRVFLTKSKHKLYFYSLSSSQVYQYTVHKQGLLPI
jgi:hypothetical protein